MDLLRTESYRRGIAFSVIFNLFAKAAGFAVSLAVAYFFGTRADTDIYFYCVFAAGLAAGFASGINASVLIPESMRLHERDGERQSMAFLNLFLYVYAVFGVAVMLCALAPESCYGLFSRFGDSVLHENAGILYLSLPLFGLMVMAGYMTDILTSKKFFTVPMAASIICNLTIIAFIWIFHARMGVASMMAGIVCGYALNVVLMTVLMKARLGWNFGASGAKLSARTGGNVFYSLAGSAASVLSSYIPVLFLSGLDAGSVSSLNYGRQLAELPNTVVTNQFSSVAGIKFNETYARSDWPELNRVFCSVGRFLLFVLVPLSCLGYIYARDAVEIIFRRGAFNAVSAALSADFLRLFIILLPLLLINTLTSRLFSAAQKVREGFIVQLVFNVLLVGVIMLSIGHWGALGYPLALIIMYAVQVLAMFLIFGWWFPEVSYMPVFGYGVRVAAFNAVPFGAALYLKDALGLSPLPNIMLGTLIFAAAVYVMIKTGVNRDAEEVFLRLSPSALWKRYAG